ncbi:MAG TPA: hypothetical protein V6D10_07290 [Trichocoleus sp.]|jgi:hypothetical protein
MSKIIQRRTWELHPTSKDKDGNARPTITTEVDLPPELLALLEKPRNQQINNTYNNNTYNNQTQPESQNYQPSQLKQSVSPFPFLTFLFGAIAFFVAFAYFSTSAQLASAQQQLNDAKVTIGAYERAMGMLK